MSNLRFGSLEIRDTSVTRVTNKNGKILDVKVKTNHDYQKHVHVVKQ